MLDIKFKENREFKVDRNVIYHLIKSQSGYIDKAIIELIQNSFDAQATKCEIEISNEGFSCTDNGKGFQSRSEIESFFETFGTPHLEDNSRTFGRFRMGRGQIMAKAKTVWRSGSFQMNVDIKNQGLNYEFIEEMDIYNGCQITGKWYEGELGSWPLGNIKAIIEDIKRSCQYMQGIQIFINNQLASLDAKKADAETDDFYYFNKDSWHGLSVNNLGVNVSNFPNKRVLNHISGIVVTKKHLELNTSRNEVLSTCKLWTKIVEDLKVLFPIPKKAKRLSEYERQNLIYLSHKGEMNYSAMLKSKVFVAYNSGKRFSLYDIALSAGTFSFYMGSLSPENNVDADKITQKGLANVLSIDSFRTLLEEYHDVELCIEDYFEELYYYLSTTKEDFKSHLPKNQRQFGVLDYKSVFEKFKPFSELAKMVQSEEFEILKDDELNKKELAALRAIKYAVSSCRRQMCYGTQSQRRIFWKAMNRKIYAGESTDAMAWTDGKEYIAFNRGLLRLIDNGMFAADQAASCWIHEVCHNKGKTDIHDLEFYENYHHLTAGKSIDKFYKGSISYLAYYINKNYAINLLKAGYKVPSRVSKHIAASDSFWHKLEIAKSK
jgi:hypothetical protein